MLALVKKGLGAMERAHKSYIDDKVQKEFADSLDIDAAFHGQNPNDNRWDYLLGHKPSGHIIGLEPHSARQDEVSTVVAKRRAALNQLRAHLKPGTCVKEWLWVASGKVQFADTEKMRRQLDQNGITFVGTKVLAKHLPPTKPKK